MAGARLELLLGTIKRDRAGARFLLLSPYLPNNEELVEWLGDDRALPPIKVDWKPARKLVGAVDYAGRGTGRRLVFRTLAAAESREVRPGVTVPIGPAPAGKKTIKGLTRATVGALERRGSVLVLCRGRGTAVTRARELGQGRPLLPEHPLREAVCRYVDAEVGRASALADALRRGVAYHHAGLSQETRWLVERLIQGGLVSVICGTTTLAQGMNFPISTVVVESLEKGDDELSYEDFWNIAGRAGRALVDTVGVVAFPTATTDQQAQFDRFLRGEAREISSQLATLIARADEIARTFDLETVRRWPALSALMQFLAHALRVSGRGNVADEVDDILRASLVYRQAQRQGEEAARRLVQLCRSYLTHIAPQRGVLVLADKTGFATPSVIRLLRDAAASHELSDPRNWEPQRLFGPDVQPLQRRVETIAQLPEIELGQGARPPFDARRVAMILRDWVRGEPLARLADQHRLSDEQDPEKRVTEFSNYLFSRLLSRASWGIGALEGVCLAGTGRQPSEDAGHVPSMIYFGVRTKEAVLFRMAGAPRVVAEGLGRLWVSQGRGEAPTYDDVRSWVSGLDDAAWRQVIPTGTPLSPSDMRLIWGAFTA